ncbi:MAG: transposase [Bacteroidetes bacterium]|nr:transposase [Bacteroidota bacterium]
MDQTSFKAYYRRNLPHIHLPQARYFITFRLANSLPQEVVERLRAEYNDSLTDEERSSGDVLNERQRIYFEKFDQLLDESSVGDRWLERAEIADCVFDALRFYDGTSYDLLCCTVMSNHVHMLVDHSFDSSGKRIEEVLQSIKKYTARRSNHLLDRTGAQFWQHESYDHIVRDEQEAENVIRYILYNPVKAGLCNEWHAWKHTYLKEEYRRFFR